jgi:uncharacterized protein
MSTSGINSPQTGTPGVSTDAETIVLRGRGLTEGVAEGEAFVTRQRIAGWGGIDSTTGTIIESRHEARGQSFAGKVLVFPGVKGSSGGSGVFHMNRLEGAGPKAMIFNAMNTKVAVVVAVSHVPCVTDLDADPLEVIETGDWVVVDGGTGLVTVRKALPDSAAGR